jgi:hypothetical protein
MKISNLKARTRLIAGFGPPLSVYNPGRQNTAVQQLEF